MRYITTRGGDGMVALAAFVAVGYTARHNVKSQLAGGIRSSVGIQKVIEKFATLTPVTEKLINRVPTPCIGVCSTGIGDVVCRGCKRFAHEVIHWNSYTDEQKRIIDARLDQFLAQVVAVKVQILDAGLLERQLRAQQIRFSAHKDPHVWVFQLLRAGASQIAVAASFGFVVRPGYEALTLIELREQIDREFFVLSEAHYQRYFAVGDRSGPVVDDPACPGASLSALDVC